MSIDVPPQCRTCVDYWVREFKGADEFLTVSRGGHIPEAHQQNYGQSLSKGESSSSNGGSNPNINNGGLPRDDNDQPMKTEIIRLRSEVETWRNKYSKADQEIKQLKASGCEKSGHGLDSYKSKLPKNYPQKKKKRNSSTCMHVSF